MTREEYWFLNLVVRYPWYFSDLPSTSGQNDFHPNARANNLAEEDMIPVLSRLFTDGDMIAFRSEDDSDSDAERFVPSPSDITNGLAGKENTYFGLTKQGGARWESASRVNWNIFLTEIGLPIGTDEEIINEVVVTAVDRELIAEWIDTVDMPISDLSWSEVAPWEPTYWKQLPHAYSATYLLKFSADLANYGTTTMDEAMLNKKADDRVRVGNKLSKWYTNPWDESC